MTADELVELRDVRAFVRTGRARQTRLLADLSLSEVARSVGVSTAAIYRWEVSDRTPRGEAALRYWRLLQKIMVKTLPAVSLHPPSIVQTADFTPALAWLRMARGTGTLRNRFARILRDDFHMEYADIAEFLGVQAESVVANGRLMGIAAS